MNNRFSIPGLLSAALIFTGCASAPAQAGEQPPLRTVSRVELPRYMGRWHEIASFPQRFQKGCTRTTADYRLLENGKVEVVNRCLVNGKEKLAKGKAYAVDETNAKLRVSFFWPFYGDYWIVDLGEDYEFAVVGAPDRDYLWILSRTPRMERALYERLLTGIRQQGFDLSRLVLTSELK